MAKKIKHKLKINIDAHLKVAMPREAVEKIKSEISNGKAGISVVIPYGDGIEYMMSIYIDHLGSGEINIVSWDDGMASVIVKGEVMQELDSNFDSGLIEALKVEMLEVKCYDVCDSDVNSYYLDGNDKARVKVGECVLAP